MFLALGYQFSFFRAGISARAMKMLQKMKWKQRKAISPPE